MGKRCTPATWKCSLLIGSVLTWTLGIVLFGMSLSAIRKPIFMPSVIPLVSGVYQKILVALAGAIFICLVAVLGYFGAACKRPCLLLTYACGLATLWIYQVAVGITLLYEKTETFPYIQFLSVDICQYRKQQLRGRQGRLLSQEDLIESVTRAEANARLFNRNVALLLEEQKAKGLATDCSPVKDFLTPIASVLFIASVLYVYFGYCTVRLAHHVWTGQRLEKELQEVKFESRSESNELSPSLGDDFLESLVTSDALNLDTPKGRTSFFAFETDSSSKSTRRTTHRSGSSEKKKGSVISMIGCKNSKPDSRKVSATSPGLTTPRFPATGSTSSGSFYFTPPMAFVPEIILCPPTP